MEKRYKIIWKGQEAGPYTLEQIQMMLDSRQIGLAHQVVMDGKRVLMGDFLKFLESEQQQVAQQAELKRLEEERQAKHARQLDMIKAQESQRESEHRREIEMQHGHAAPPALPPQPGHSPQPVDSPQPGYPPQPVVAEAGGNSAAKAGGGFTVFVIVALGFLWYQGYWSPSDIKAIWGQSKSIEVIRNKKLGDAGDTIGKGIARNLTGVKWKSKRGDSREEVIITCTGNYVDNGKTEKVKVIWVVNKEEKTFNMTDIFLDGRKIPKDAWIKVLVIILD